MLTLVVVPVLYSYLVRDRKGAAAPESFTPLERTAVAATDFTGGGLDTRMPAAKD